MRLRFEDILNSLKSTMKENMEERERLSKLKKGVPKAEIERPNGILEKKLENTEDICKVVNAVYAMGRTIEERKGIKRVINERKKEQNEEKRRVRKKDKQIEEVGQAVAWAANELNRKKIKTKATKKERSCRN